MVKIKAVLKKFNVDFSPVLNMNQTRGVLLCKALGLVKNAILGYHISSG